MTRSRPPSSNRGFTRPSALALLACVAHATTATALDKQGSAHGGAVGGDDTGTNFSGALTYGVALINPSYAARPDNTGRTLFRYAAHGDLDLIGRRLSFPIDVNVFTDRERRGMGIFAPTELDVIGGVTSTNPVFRGGDLEIGARVEHDRPVDRGRFTQTYADVRARLLYSLGTKFPSLKRDLVDGDVSGFVTLGWFAVNPTYAARPDNSGLALLRYAVHSELSVWHDYLSLGFDATFFSDRRASNVLAPSEVDVTYELIGRRDPFETHLAYERDMPIDRGGLVQSFVYALFVYTFDLKHPHTQPFESRRSIPSP